MLERVLAELQSPDGGWLKLSPKQEEALKLAMANYALAALMDSSIAKEAESICEEFEGEKE
jgi:hypothetical protein